MNIFNINEHPDPPEIIPEKDTPGEKAIHLFSTQQSSTFLRSELSKRVLIKACNENFQFTLPRKGGQTTNCFLLEALLCVDLPKEGG
jgi:hypothetical protein